MFKKENFKIPFYLIIAVIAAVSVSISIQSLLAAWQAPSATPPDANIDAPVNVGTDTQVKSGILGVTNDFYVGSVGSQDIFFVDGSGTGNVGIGVNNPNNLLQVSGLINFPNDKAGTFIGYQAGNVNTGDHNTFVGYESGLDNTTGSYNTAMGYGSLHNNTTGSNNTAIGHTAFFFNTTGSYNTAMGKSALVGNTTGISNTAIGMNALAISSVGIRNTAIGFESLYNNISGSYNTAIGFESLYNNTFGDYNTAIGISAGKSITTSQGDSNTFLGYEAGYNTSQKTDALNSMALGNGSYTTLNNQVVIGNNAITQTLLKGNVGIGTTNPQTKLEVDGVIRTTPRTSAPACDSNSRGGIYYNSTDNNFWGCRYNGAAYEWKQLNN